MALLRGMVLGLFSRRSGIDIVSLELGDARLHERAPGWKSVWDRLAEPRVIQAHPANAPGPFYSENDGCITRGAPRAEAPAFIGWYEERCGADTHSHCIFLRQPSSPDELEQAIRAMHVSCVENLRYQGSDPSIIARLRALGMAHLGDDIADPKPLASEMSVPPDTQPN